MNMMRVLVTLITYEDWVWSHPNPQLVANYLVPGSPPYQTEFKEVREMAKEGIRSDPSPTEIDWIRVTGVPKAVEANGKPIVVRSHHSLLSASVEVVLNQKGGENLNARNQVVNRIAGVGKHAFSVEFSRTENGPWRIDDIIELNVHGGLASLSPR
jgi:hypothetical protein